MTKPTKDFVDSVSPSGETQFRSQFLRALVLVLTGLAVLFGLIATSLMLGLILIGCHILVSVFLVIAISRGTGKRRDFALVCIIPNVAGYLFAIGGTLGWERWLFISLSIFVVLGMTGLSRRLIAVTLSNEESMLQRIPIVGRWFGGKQVVEADSQNPGGQKSFAGEDFDNGLESVSDEDKETVV